MTNSEYFKMLSMRKSVRKFDGPLTPEELALVEVQCQNLVSLVDGLETKILIVPRRNTPARFGEHCLLIYSAPHPLDKVNAGYMLQQMDLFLEKNGFGCCWYGMAKPEERRLDGLDFVIMLTFGKGLDGGYRSGAEDFKRMASSAIWSGNSKFADVVRLAPSACNSQPWRFTREDNVIRVYRETELKTIIPQVWRPLFNGVDVGISLFFLETALREAGQSFTRRLLSNAPMEGSRLPIAEYGLN